MENMKSIPAFNYLRGKVEVEAEVEVEVEVKVEGEVEVKVKGEVEQGRRSSRVSHSNSCFVLEVLIDISVDIRKYRCSLQDARKPSFCRDNLALLNMERLGLFGEMAERQVFIRKLLRFPEPSKLLVIGLYHRRFSCEVRGLNCEYTTIS